jgi:hypothetical protein
MRALEPARAGMRGLKTSRRREHARGVSTPHHRQVTEIVGETAPACTGRLCPGERPMRNFANEGHSAITETAQGFKGDGAESVTRTVVVSEGIRSAFPGPGYGQRYRLAGRSDAHSWERESG